MAYNVKMGPTHIDTLLPEDIAAAIIAIMLRLNGDDVICKPPSPLKEQILFTRDLMGGTNHIYSTETLVDLQSTSSAH